MDSGQNAQSLDKALALSNRLEYDYGDYNDDKGYIHLSRIKRSMKYE